MIMNEVLNIAAEVLEKAASYVDALEAEKLALDASVHAKVAAELKQKFAEATGEEVNDVLVNKLAKADPEVLALMDKLAGSSHAPDSLGQPSDNSDDNSASPSNKKEAAAQAEARMLSWLQA